MIKKIALSFGIAAGLMFIASYINSAVNGVRSDFKSDQKLVNKIAAYRS